MKKSILNSLEATGVGTITCALLAASPLAHAVEVTNVKDGEVFRYPLVVIEGTSRGKLQFKSAAEASLDTTVADKFRGVVELKAGRNELAFKDDAGVKTLALTYKPATAEDYRVKVWYVVPKDADPLQVKADQVDPLYQTKLDLLTKVMQSWVAEDMKCGGYGTKTFYPEMRKDAPSKVDVGLLYTNQTRAQWSAQGNSYDIARSVLPPQYATPKWRNLAFITCANVAQSSDNFCVIGYGTLVGKQGKTWEMNIADIVKAVGSAGNFSYMAVDVEGNEAHSFYVPPAAAK